MPASVACVGPFLKPVPLKVGGPTVRASLGPRSGQGVAVCRGLGTEPWACGCGVHSCTCQVYDGVGWGQRQEERRGGSWAGAAALCLWFQHETLRSPKA